MSEAYWAALRQEITAWQDVEGVVRDQRQAIIRREAQAVWDSQEALRESLRQALVAHGEAAALQAEGGAEAGDLQQEARRAQQQVRDAVRLNHELLKDICSYLEMIREVLMPQPLPAAYGPTRLPQADFRAPDSRVA